MASNGKQGTERPRLGTTAWPPGLLIPIPERWPADFAVRELLAVDTTDEEAVRQFAERWGPVSVSAPTFGQVADVETETTRLRWAQRSALIVLEVLLASQEEDWPLLDRLAAQTHLTFGPTEEVEELSAALLGDLVVGPFLQDHLAWAYPRLSIVGFDEPPQPHTWADVVAGQLFNYVSQRSGWQQCANDPAHPDGRGQWFTVQRTDRRKVGGYGPQDASKKSRFCSRQCARAYTERERRRRRREEGTQA